MRIILCDDYPIFREGLKSLLESGSNYRVVGQANDGLEALELVNDLHPDIVVLDISMPRLSGLEAVEQIKDLSPDTAIVILSRHSDSVMVERALNLGAVAYVHKDAAFDELIIALNAVSMGRNYLSSAVLGPVVNRYLRTPIQEGAGHQYDQLTPREKEVFHQLSKGNSRRVIADTLNITPKTADRHKSNIMEKLKLKNDDEIMAFARELGILE